MENRKWFIRLTIICLLLHAGLISASADGDEWTGGFEDGTFTAGSNGGEDCNQSPVVETVVHTEEGSSGSPGSQGGGGVQAEINDDSDDFYTTGGSGSSLVNTSVTIDSGEGNGSLSSGEGGFEGHEQASGAWLTCGGETIFTMEDTNEVGSIPSLVVNGNINNVDFGDNYESTLEGIGQWFLDFLTGNAEMPTCGGEEGSGGREEIEEICWVEFVLGPGIIVCGGEYSVVVSASVGCPTLIREPYPRAIVGEPITFQLSTGGTVHAEGGRREIDPTLKDYKLEIEWLQLPMIPRWDFNDYRWSNRSNIGLGWTVQHTYETSSFGKTPNGPSDYGYPDLPAYQVHVETYWQPRLKESWKQWRSYNFNCDNLQAAGDYSGYTTCVSDRAYCSSLGLNGRVDDDRCGEWQNRGSGWINIDLRWYGWPTPWYVQNSVKDVTPMPPNLPPLDPPIPGCITPVPVIESQALLSGN